MGAGRLITLLSRVLALFGLTLGLGTRWRSKHHTETRSQVLEAWSLSLDGDLDPVTGVEWVGLVCAWSTNRACVLGYPAGIHLFMNRRFRETVRLAMV